MPVAEAHPSAKELSAFTLGTLDSEAQASIEAHVAGCTSCQERAAVAPGDSLVELLRRLDARAERGADIFVDTAAQVETPAPLVAVAETEGLAPAVALFVSAESGRPKIPEAIPPELAGHERYRVVRLLGSGGMGTVYEAVHRVMQRPYALKVIKRAYTANVAALERFRREVLTAARLSHPNIVAITDAEDAGGTHFLVMEYVQGTDLGRLVQEHGPLPVDRACEYVRQAAVGLQYAFEQGMVHRDLKPHNLMLTPEGRVKVLDFGLAWFVSEGTSAASLTGTGVVLGTVDYIAPEQADNAHQADIRSDIYSLGCTLYHLLAGQPPFPTGTPIQKVMAHREKQPQSLTELRPDLPEGFMPVLERMMAKDPKHRYQTPAEVAIALEPFTAITAKVPGWTHATDSGDTMVLKKKTVRDRRRPQFAIAVATVAFLVAGLLGVGVYRIVTDNGVLEIRTDNPDVEVVFSQRGEVVKIIDTKNGKYVTLRSGDYELALKDGEGLKIVPGKVTVMRGQTVLATIERIPKAVVERVGDEIRRFGAPGHPVRRLALSPDGKRLLTAGCKLDGTARYWDIATGKEIYRLPSQVQVYDVAISPDGSKLLSCSTDRLIHVYDAASGKEVMQLKGHTGEVKGVAISPDGKMVASAGYDCQLRLWNLDTGELIASPGTVGGGWGVAFSPDGKLVATFGQERVIRLWDVKNLKEVRRLEGHKEWVLAAAFSGDGSRLLSGTWPSDDRGPVARPSELKLWEVTTGKLLRTIDLLPASNVHGLAISPDGRQALTCSDSGGPADLVELWDLERGKSIVTLRGHLGAVGDVAFLPGGRTAVSGGYDDTIRLWRLPEPPPPERVGEIRRFEGHTGEVWHVALSADGRFALSVGQDQTGPAARLWNVATGKQVFTFAGLLEDNLGVAFSPDSKTAFCGGGWVRCWDVATGKELPRLRSQPDCGRVRTLHVSDDSRKLLAGGIHAAVLWDLQTNKVLQHLDNSGWIHCAALSPDGTQILTGADAPGGAPLMCLWDAKTGQEIRRFAGHTNRIHDVAFAPDGKRCVSCSSYGDNTLRVYDLASGKELLSIPHPGGLQRGTFLPDSQRFLSTCGDGVVRMWDVRTGQELYSFKAADPGGVNGVAVSRDGRHALTGGNDKTVRLWRLPDLLAGKGKP
jgi:WD40 repeat protein